jgi:hypothetical protein
MQTAMRRLRPVDAGHRIDQLAVGRIQRNLATSEVHEPPARMQGQVLRIPLCHQVGHEARTHTEFAAIARGTQSAAALNVLAGHPALGVLHRRSGSPMP